ncbi:hypothetical protein B0H19DRAFT_1261621 [Mycena capillaripes]|nr:hypothetical protein B0H19DRAFT_1261621 [Mycena capillaripes]
MVGPALGLKTNRAWTPASLANASSRDLAPQSPLPPPALGLRAHRSGVHIPVLRNPPKEGALALASPFVPTTPERALAYRLKLQGLPDLARQGCQTLVCVVGESTPKCALEEWHLVENREYLIAGMKREILGLLIENSRTLTVERTAKEKGSRAKSFTMDLFLSVTILNWMDSSERLYVLLSDADKYNVTISKILEELNPVIFEHGNRVIHDLTIASVDRFLDVLWAEDKALARVWELFSVLLIGTPRDPSWTTNTRLLAIVFEVSVPETLPGGHRSKASERPRPGSSSAMPNIANGLATFSLRTRGYVRGDAFKTIKTMVWILTLVVILLIGNAVGQFRELRAMQQALDVLQNELHDERT